MIRLLPSELGISQHPIDPWTAYDDSLSTMKMRYYIRLLRKTRNAMVAVAVLTTLPLVGLPLAGSPIAALAESLPANYWEPSYAAALAKAKKEKKPLFVMITSEDCGPCRSLEQKTLPDKDVIESLAPFVKAQVWADKDKERELARELGERGTPTMAFLDADGTRVEVFSGYCPPGEFLARCSTAMQKLKVPIPAKVQAMLNTAVKIDMVKARKLAADGKKAELLAMLRPVEKDQVSQRHYLVADVNLPAELDGKDIEYLWGSMYHQMPKSGLLLLESQSERGVLTIKVPGYEQIQDYEPFGEDKVSSKSYSLSKLTPETSGSIKGHVELNNGKPAAGAVVVLPDWDRTVADARGYFKFKSVAPGRMEMQVQYPGYRGRAFTTVTAGVESKAHVPPLNPATTISIRWVYQGDKGQTSFIAGHPKSGSAIVNVTDSRFSLRRAQPLHNWGSDFMLMEKGGVPLFWAFDASGTNGMVKVDTAFDKLTAADPKAKYQLLRGVLPRKGDVYLVRCCEDDHYAKLEITDVTEYSRSDLMRHASAGDLVALKKDLLLDWAPKQGSDALCAALVRKHADCLKLLMENGANPNPKSWREGQNAMQFAKLLGDAKLLQILETTKPVNTEVFTRLIARPQVDGSSSRSTTAGAIDYEGD